MKRIKSEMKVLQICFHFCYVDDLTNSNKIQILSASMKPKLSTKTFRFFWEIKLNYKANRFFQIPTLYVLLNSKDTVNDSSSCLVIHVCRHHGQPTTVRIPDKQRLRLAGKCLVKQIQYYVSPILLLDFTGVYFIRVYKYSLYYWGRIKLPTRERIFQIRSIQICHIYNISEQLTINETFYTYMFLCYLLKSIFSFHIEI